MVKIGALVSGGGTNLQQLIDAQAAGKLGGGEIAVVISSKPEVYALERAKKAGIEAVTLSRKEYSDVEAYSQALIDALKARGIELVVLSGFLTITSDAFVRAFPDRIMNVHPALLPAFGGKGFWPAAVSSPGPRYTLPTRSATADPSSSKKRWRSKMATPRRSCKSG